MTNPDTSTLNGALEQLGITMADNLVTMGVSDADPSDGLTTLAGKILEIAPVPPTPTPASLDLSLTAGKQILSYVDRASGNEYATLSALVLDENDDPLPGVSVSIYKDNVLWYTAETGAGGTISKTYDSEGVGDVSFHAVCGSFVTERFAIEDCTYYSTTTHTVYNATLDIPLPTTFTLEYIQKQFSTTYSVPYLDIGDSTNNRMLIGQYAKAGTNGIIVYKGSQTNHPYGTNIPLNQDNMIWFKYDGTKYYYKLNDGTVMEVADANVTLSKLIHVEGAGGNTGNYLKNIKIKPL